MARQTLKSSSSFAIILFLMAALAGLSGCAKQRAGYSLNKAKKRLVEARDFHQAATYLPQDLQNTEARVNEAQTALDGQQFEQALELARTASDLAKDLLDTTKAKKANFLMGEADKHVRIANDNQGSTINPQLHNQILETQTKARTALGKQKHDRVITLCEQIQKDVDILLESLKIELESKFQEANNLLQDLYREDGRAEAPQFVTDAEAKIAEMRQQTAYEQRQYLRARQTFTEITVLVQNGITEARRSRSKKKITLLESKLLRAIQEEAEKYHTELLRNSQRDFIAINQNFFSENYVLVLDAADLLEPTLEKLILETRIFAAQDRMNIVAGAIARLEADKVREYLPGRLEKMDDLLKQARDFFEQDLFDEVKTVFAYAMEERELILRDYDTFAQNEIRSAKGTLDRAILLLDRTQEIFDILSAPTEDPVRIAFENSKQALKTELIETSKESEIILAIADTQRLDNRFSAAIENSRKVVRYSNYIIHQVYHTLAHNNVLEIANMATHTAGDGGTQFASDEMARAQATLQQARDMIREQEAAGQPDRDGAFDPDAYKMAVAKTSDAYAEIEVVIQRVKQVASEKMKQARNAIETAEENKASVYALGNISTAKQLLQQSEELLAAESLYSSAQRADDARKLAVESNLTATQTWAAEVLQTAEQEIEKASQSGADHYAPLRYRDSRNRVTTALEIYRNAQAMTSMEDAAKAFRESMELAEEGRKAAFEARMKPVSDADEAIQTAKRFQAWEYDYSTVLQAIIRARIALDAMEAGEYQLARQRAAEAEQIARTAARRAQSATFKTRVDADSRELIEATREGGLYFTLDEIYDLLARLRELGRNYSVERHETVSADLDEFERDLTALVESIPKVFNDAADSQRALYNELTENQAEDFAADEMREADRQLRYSRLDFDRGDYRAAYKDLRRATEVLAQVEQRHKEMVFADEIHTVFAQLEETKKLVAPLMGMSPSVVDFMRRTHTTRTRNFQLAGVDYLEFRRQMDQLYVQVQNMDHPMTMQAEFEKLEEAVRLSREASFAFEKFLILEHYDSETAGEIVRNAYRLMTQSKTLTDELSRQFHRKGLQGRLARFEGVIAE